MSTIDNIILNGVTYSIGGSGSGLTDELKSAIDQLAYNVAYADDDGPDYYDAIHEALYPPAPPASLSYITAVYTQSGTVYDTDSLNSLKTNLVVTAHYTNGTTSTVSSSAYTLSGSLTAGTSTITVSYGGKTTTFNVTVTHQSVQTVYIANVGTFIRDHAYGANTDSVSDNFRNSVYSITNARSGDVLVLPAGTNSTTWETNRMISKTGTSTSTPTCTLGTFVQESSYGYYPIILGEDCDILYVACTTEHASVATWTRESGF